MNIVSVSGGKDSTALLLRMIDENIKIDRILFADTGLELPETYEFINKLSNYCYEKIGLNISILKSNKSWDYYFYKVRKTGKLKGQIRGFPMVIQHCWYQRDCKDKLLSKRAVKYDTVFIGYASDEKRGIKDKKSIYRYPLKEWGMTEQDCMNYCKEKGWLNPLYKKYGFKRLGCWCCPKQPIKDLRVIRDYYPDLWIRLLKYEEDSPHGFKPDFKLKELSK